MLLVVVIAVVVVVLYVSSRLFEIQRLQDVECGIALSTRGGGVTNAASELDASLIQVS